MSWPSSAGNSAKQGIECQNGGIDISRVTVIIRIPCDHRPGNRVGWVGGRLFNPTLKVSSVASYDTADFGYLVTRGFNET